MLRMQSANGQRRPRGGWLLKLVSSPIGLVGLAERSYEPYRQFSGDIRAACSFSRSHAVQHKSQPPTPSVDVERRRGLRLGAALATGWRLPQARAADAPALLSTVLATPGPGSSVSAIPELAVKIADDRAEGLALRCWRRRRNEPCAGIAVSHPTNGKVQARCSAALVCRGSAGSRHLAQLAVGGNTPCTAAPTRPTRARPRRRTGTRPPPRCAHHTAPRWCMGVSEPNRLRWALTIAA